MSRARRATPGRALSRISIGAVVGGRLGYALVHLDYFGANPGAIVDPSVGSMQLSLAVAGGLATGWVIASLLETPAGRWLHVTTLPLLFDFPRDMARVPAQVNRLSNQVLVNKYEREWGKH